MRLVFLIYLLSLSNFGFADERLLQTTGRNYQLLDDDPYKSEEAKQARAMMRDELTKLFANDLQYQACQITLQQYRDHLLEGEQSLPLNAGKYKIVVDAPGEVSETIDADARIWSLKVSGGLAKDRYLPSSQELRIGDDSTALTVTDYLPIRKKKLPSLIPCFPLMGETCPTHKTVGYIKRTLTLTVDQAEVTAFSLTDKYYRRVLTGYLPYKEKSPLNCKE